MSNLSFVNAAFNNGFAGWGIYVRYGDFKEFRLISESLYHAHIICPDRELYICNNCTKSLANPILNNYDEFLDLNIYGQNFKKFLPQYMLNYTDFASAPDKSSIVKNEKSPLIFCDSGGFQIGMGRTDIINPINLAKFYNENINLGMVLDIPEYSEDDPLNNDLVMGLAEVQKRNNEYMLKYLNKDVELINIIHGGTLDQKLMYLNKVHNDKIHRLALPSVNIPMTLPRLNLIFEICRQAKKLGSYKHLHLLGCFNKRTLAVLAKLAHCNIPEVQGLDFTTDASTSIQTSINYLYTKNINIWEGVNEYIPSPNEKFTLIDHHKGKYSDGLLTPNPASMLPCNCPICSTIKYSYILRNLRAGDLMKSIFVTHNSIEMFNYVDLLNNYAKNLTTEQYTQYVKRIQEDDGSNSVNCLKFIKRVEEVGLDKAREEFNSLLENNVKVRSLKSSLLTMKKDTSSKTVFEERISSLIDKYLNTDFENYKGEVTLSKAFRSATSLQNKG